MSKTVTINPGTQLLEGVRILADAVASTLGPKGKSVIIESDFGLPIVTKDGATVAKSIDLEDKVQNLGAQIIKQAAAKTLQTAGDGTTTATIIAYTLFKEARKLIAVGYSPIDITRKFKSLSEAIVSQIESHSTPVNAEDIRKIAITSSNNDTYIGDLISSAYEYVGKEGVISLDDSKTDKTYVKLVDGINFDKGYMSPYFVTDPEKMTCSMENPLILLTDKKIRSTNEIVPAMEHAMRASRPLVVIADDIDGQALSLMLVNKLRSGFPVVAIKAPAYGDRRGELLKDFAVLTGAELITEAKALRLEDVKISDLGA